MISYKRRLELPVYTIIYNDNPTPKDTYCIKLPGNYWPEIDIDSELVKDLNLPDNQEWWAYHEIPIKKVPSSIYKILAKYGIKPQKEYCNICKRRGG